MNEPVKGYAPGSGERAALEAKIKELGGEQIDLTMTIGGEQRLGGGAPIDVVEPHNRRHVLGQLKNATDDDVRAAIDAAREAAPGWRAMSFDDRAAILLKAAELLSGPWRATLKHHPADRRGCDGEQHGRDAEQRGFAAASPAQMHAPGVDARRAAWMQQRAGLMRR